MALQRNQTVLRQLRTLYNVGATRELTDGQLLERFARGRGEAAELAFAVLLERHGPMVLRVCQGVLADAHDSQDAFQATFLVLVRKARGLWVRDSLGPWLHQVAHRTASAARTASARRRRHERRAAALATTAVHSSPGAEIEWVLHAEIDGLPERYRAPVVLCDLQGRSHDQAARHLGWPVGTVKSRLTRGRQRLRDRLARHGIGPEAGLLVAVARPGSGDGLVPGALAEATARAAVQSATAGAGTLAAAAAAPLAQGVLRSMILARWLKIASVLLVAGALAAGADVLAHREVPQGGPRTDGKGTTARDNDAPVDAAQAAERALTIAAKGVVEASRSEFVTSRVEGSTTIVSLVPEGTKVMKGQVVAQLDPSGLLEKLKQQKVATAGAQAEVENARLTREVLAIAVVEYAQGTGKPEPSEITKLRAERKRAEDRVVWSNQMYEKGYVTKAQNIADRVTLQQKLFALAQAQTKKDVLEMHTKGKTIKQLQSELEKAKSNELARTQFWELEKQKEAALEAQIKSCTLTAPLDGTVFHANDRNPGVDRPPAIEKGARVRERQLIVFVRDLEGSMRVNAKVPEAWVDRIKPGQKARIKVDAFAGASLAGTVEQIAPRPDPRRFSDPDVNVYSTRVAIDGHFRGLVPGMTAEVEIIVDAARERP
jgi:RNA polymerase sigma factor (sigma-70 family)